MKLMDKMCQQYDCFQAWAVELTKNQPQENSLTGGKKRHSNSQKDLPMLKSIFECIFRLQ